MHNDQATAADYDDPMCSKLLGTAAVGMHLTTGKNSAWDWRADDSADPASGA